MKLDETFVKEIKKIANGDGSRDAKFIFLRIAKAAAKELSSPSVEQIFDEVLRKYGRVAVGICLAATILERRERLSPFVVQWAHCVINLWDNRPRDISDVHIDDGLHPTKIEVYGRVLIRATAEE